MAQTSVLGVFFLPCLGRIHFLPPGQTPLVPGPGYPPLVLHLVSVLCGVPSIAGCLLVSTVPLALDYLPVHRSYTTRLSRKPPSLRREYRGHPRLRRLGRLERRVINLDATSHLKNSIDSRDIKLVL